MNEEILFFTAPWCGPCQQMKRVIKESNVENLNINIIDISEEGAMQKVCDYEVLNVPLFIKLVDNKETNRKAGSITINELQNL